MPHDVAGLALGSGHHLFLSHQSLKEDPLLVLERSLTIFLHQGFQGILFHISVSIFVFKSLRAWHNNRFSDESDSPMMAATCESV